MPQYVAKRGLLYLASHHYPSYYLRTADSVPPPSFFFDGLYLLPPPLQDHFLRDGDPSFSSSSSYQPPGDREEDHADDHHKSWAKPRICLQCKRYIVPPWDRPIIFISSRVHPGESSASWVFQGLLSFLLSPQSPPAMALRERFQILLVPMLNPDGVVAGCTRCSLSGQDLNRMWKDPHPQQHPSIFCSKALLHQAQLGKNRVLLFLDLHAHSTKLDVFM